MLRTGLTLAAAFAFAAVFACDFSSESDDSGGGTGGEGVSECRDGCDRSFELCGDAGFSSSDHAACRELCATADADRAATYESCVDASTYVTEMSCPEMFIPCWTTFNGGGNADGGADDGGDGADDTAGDGGGGDCDAVCAHVQMLADADPDCTAFPPDQCATGCADLSDDQRACMLDAATCPDLVPCVTG